MVVLDEGMSARPARGIASLFCTSYWRTLVSIECIRICHHNPTLITGKQNLTVNFSQIAEYMYSY